MKTKKILLAGLIAVLAFCVGVGARLKFKSQGATHPAFTLRSRVIYDNGSDKYEGEQTRYAFSDGSYRVIYSDERGGHKEYFFKRGMGFFNVSHSRKLLVRNPQMSPVALSALPPTAEELQRSPQFIKTETVLGLRAYVQRVVDSNTGLPLTDLYFAVELGRTPLKEVVYQNGKPVVTIEPINIIWGEPDAASLKVPNYQIVDKE